MIIHKFAYLNSIRPNSCLTLPIHLINVNHYFRHSKENPITVPKMHANVFRGEVSYQLLTLKWDSKNKIK